MPQPVLIQTIILYIGIRTGAGVGKGGKEETKARNQEKKNKNKIKNLDRDLFYDRPRLKSNSEGQTNNFLNKKSKILKYVKRKKLYHPKKHYVRIQIPRKGYFYRSLEFRPSQSATNPVNRKLESASLPTKSEIQIARLASTSAKGSDIHKKRIEKPTTKTASASAAQRDDDLSLVRDYLDGINFILNQQMVGQEFEKEINRLALGWPLENSVAPEEVSSLENVGSASLLKNLDSEGDLPYKSETKIEKHDDGLQIESVESYCSLEAQIQNSMANCAPPEQSDSNPDPSFVTLLEYLRDSLGKGCRYASLEISPALLMDKNFESSYDHETSAKLENIKKPLDAQIDTFDENFLRPLNEEYCFETAFCEFKNDSLLKLKKSEEQVAKVMMGDIDLHSELENYLMKSQMSRKHDGDNIHVGVNKNNPSSGVNEEELFVQKRNFDSTAYGNSDQGFDPEVKSLSEDTTKLGSSEGLNSYVRSGVETVGWEEVPQESSCYTKPTIKKPAYPGCNLEEEEKLLSDLVSVLFKKHSEQVGETLDCYEKVSPIRAISKTKNKCKLLLTSPTDSTSQTQSFSKVKNTNSGSDQFQQNESIETDENIKREDDADENQSGSGKKWCPSLNELSEIYGHILQQNLKKKNSKTPSNLWYSSILSILKDKLREKQAKMDLINFTKTLKDCFKPPSDWKSGADTSKNRKLQEYVNMFQEVLLSSLSIEQITYLNNVISSLQEKEDPVECIEFMNGSEKSKKSCSNNEIQPVSVTPTPPAVSTQKNVGNPKLVKNTSASDQSKASSKGKFSLKKIKPAEKPKKVALSPPAELEMVLKSTFNSEKVGGGRKATDKILVNVKVCGSRVLVNDFAYIRDESCLSATLPSRNKVSELIIENLSGDRLRDVSQSELSVDKSKAKRNSTKSTGKAQNIKIVVKAPKLGNQKSTSKLKLKNETCKREKETKKKLNSKAKDKLDELKMTTRAKEYEDACATITLHDRSSGENQNIFEYDQELLKVQHPIDAILETSESKILENTESNENIDSSEKPGDTKDKKSLGVTEVKEVSNESPLERIFMKDLLCDIGFYDDGIRNDLFRTKSHDLSHDRDQKSDLGKAFTKDIKFLDDLQCKVRNGEKKNRKVPTRPRRTYICYSSLLVEDKSVKPKSKTKEVELSVVKNMNSNAAKDTKKTNSKVVRTLSSKSVKKTDPRVVKTTKALKGTDSKTIKTTRKGDIKDVKIMGTRASKQEDSKAVKTNSKTQKTSNKSVKESAALGRLSTGVAATKGLSARSKCISRPDQSPSKQDANAPETMTIGIDVSNNSEGPVLYINSSPNFDSETSSLEASLGSYIFEDVIKQKQKPLSETTDAINKHKNSPIVIFSSPPDQDDQSSQFAVTHSDSILKSIPHTPIIANQIDSVSKSQSDLKFYPGRISESKEEQQPWVTFVLTPQQQATADLPAGQVKIVDKLHGTGNISENEDSQKNQLSLRSIEKFIDKLRKINTKARKPRKEKGKFKNEINSSKSIKVKQKIKLSPSKAPKSKVAKIHDCAKTKTKINILEVKCKSDRKILRKETVLAKVIVKILQFLLDEREKRTKNKNWIDENSEGENVHSDLDEGGSDESTKKWGKIEKTTSDMLNAVINGVTVFEKLVEKKKLILAIKEELKKRKADPRTNVDGLLELSEKIDALKSLQKIKIETLGTDAEEGGKTKAFSSRNEIVNKAKCLLPNGGKVRDLRRKPSTYFDAEERIKGEAGGGVSTFKYQSGEPFAHKVMESQRESGIAEAVIEKECPELILASSDEILPMKAVTNQTEEVVFNKIYENLAKNNIFHSMALFESLLKKKGVLDKDEKMQSVLRTVSEQSETLLTEIEKSAWMKLHRLLEEVARMYDVRAEEVSVTDFMYNYITSQLTKTLDMSSIQVVNKKIGDLQKFLTQKQIYSDFDLNNVFSKVVTRLIQLKNSVIPRLTSSVRRFFEDDDFRSDAVYEVRQVKAAHDLANLAREPEKESQVQLLKNQIRDQRLFIEYLMNTRSGSSSTEIKHVKNKVSEKIILLERSMSSVTTDDDVGNASEEPTMSSCLDQISYLNLTETCRGGGIAKQAPWNVEECK